jgi:adenine deaminase
MMENQFSVDGNIIDVVSKTIYSGTVVVKNGKIEKIKAGNSNSGFFICPGLIDAHVHIESSMLTPVEFARMAVNHGTVAAISDPHEIANVLGKAGVLFMIENGKKVPFKFLFGAPSCVPATSFETSGAVLSPEDILDLLKSGKAGYLAEMMNFPGVIYGDVEIVKKIDIARRLNKPIDGHAPGITGKDLEKYVSAGISTDHECTQLDEALEKIELGMKILIREGSAAKDFDNLYKLVEENTGQVMLCSDDLHPDDLIKGHINLLIRKGLSKGLNLFDLLEVAVVNPIKHYGLDVGLLQEGDPADFILIDNPENFNVKSCFIDGIEVSANGVTKINSVKTDAVNNFFSYEIREKDLAVPAIAERINVIKATDGELLTKQIIKNAKIKKGLIESDTVEDVLKIVVVNRYNKADPAIGYIHGFGIKRGAIASSIAHDSHNIIAVGVSDRGIAKVINEVMNRQGGIIAYDGENISALTLNIAGIMTDVDGPTVAGTYEELNKMVIKMGTNMSTPFMTLSFMALLVIPELKIGDKGLFDVNKFAFTSLFAE